MHKSDKLEKGNDFHPELLVIKEQKDIIHINLD